MLQTDIVQAGMQFFPPTEEKQHRIASQVDMNCIAVREFTYA